MVVLWRLIVPRPGYIQILKVKSSLRFVFESCLMAEQWWAAGIICFSLFRPVHYLWHGRRHLYFEFERASRSNNGTGDFCCVQHTDLGDIGKQEQLVVEGWCGLEVSGLVEQTDLRQSLKWKWKMYYFPRLADILVTACVMLPLNELFTEPSVFLETATCPFSSTLSPLDGILLLRCRLPKLSAV